MNNGLHGAQQRAARSCNKQNFTSRDAASPAQKTSLLARHDALLRQKLAISSHFTELRKQKDLLLGTNSRLLEDEDYYTQQIHNIEREHLALYRRNQREKETLMGKLEMLRGMVGELHADQRVSQLEDELQNVKHMFQEQERVNSQRYAELVNESKQLQDQNRQMREFLRERRARGFKATC